MLTDWKDGVAWLGLVLPLLVIAWSAYRYQAERKAERLHRRFEQFFSVTDKIGQEGGSIMSKVAATYELRRFPEYAEVVARMTEDPDIRGDGRPVEILRQEFHLTREAMRQLIDK